MRKILFGFVLGAAVSLSSVAYASDSIQAFLYQAKLIINGQEKNPEASGYQMLNYEGHAYVPLRYVAEQMGTAVSYDDATKSITLDDGFDITATPGGYVRAGHLKVTPENGHSKIDVQVYFPGVKEGTPRVLGYPQPGPGIEILGKLVFWNEQGLQMEQVPFKTTLMDGIQIASLQLTSETDLSGYKAVTITDPIPVSRRLPYPPQNIMSSRDAQNQIRFGVINSIGGRVGDYTLFQMYISSTSPDFFGPVEATITFYGEQQEKLGTALVKTRLTGGSAELIEVLGRGDLTGYKTMSAEVTSMKAEPSYARKLFLNYGLLTDAAKERLTRMEFGLGATRAEVTAAWGQAQTTGSRQTQYEGWGDYQIYFSGPNATVGAIGIDGESIRFTVDEVKQLLGQPEYEGTSLVVEGWELNYKAGDYMLYMEADKPDGTVRHLTYKKQ